MKLAIAEPGLDSSFSQSTTVEQQSSEEISDSGSHLPLMPGIVSMGRNFTDIEGRVHLISNYWGLKTMLDDAPMPKDPLIAHVPTAARRYPEVGQPSPRFLDAERAWLAEQKQAGTLDYFEYCIAGKDADDIKDKLGEADVILMGGGNTQYLLQELQDTGADAVIRDLVRDGTWYVGKSAGAIVAGPDINPRGFFLDSMATRKLNDTTALDLTPVYPLPHIDTPKIMSVMCGDKTGWQIAIEMTRTMPTAYIYDDRNAGPALSVDIDALRQTPTGGPNVGA